VTARDALDGMKQRLEAATPGPWAVDECTPCTERGRLEVNIYDEPGNLMVTGWCDDDEFHRPDAAFIAAAPMDVARLIGAVEAVLERADRLSKSKQCEDREIAEDLRAAVENALNPKEAQ
jgi:hypothetical protein